MHFKMYFSFIIFNFVWYTISIHGGGFMKTKKLSLALATFTFLPVLAGCKDSPMRWNFNKTEIANFKELVGLDSVENGNRVISYSGNEYYFDKDLEKDDVKIYNYTDLLEDVKNGVVELKDGFVPYKTLLNYTTEVMEIENSYASFKVTFENSSSSDTFRVLVHKDTNIKNVYLDVQGSKEGPTNEVNIDEKFCEDYVQADISKLSEKSDLSIAGEITQIAIGPTFGTPTTKAGGIFAILTSLGNAFRFKGDISNQSTIDKLKEMDYKLDDVQTQINKNHQDLVELKLLTELGISEELMDDYEDEISDFEEIYSQPIELILKEFKSYTDAAFKQIIKSAKDINMYFVRDERSLKWVLQSSLDTDHTGQENIHFSIPNWPNATAYLEKNNDVIGDEFIDEVRKDIDDATIGITSLEGMSRKNMIENVIMLLTDEIGYSYFKNNTDVVEELDSLAEQYAYEIIDADVIRAYLERLIMIYNFGGEAKIRLAETLCALDKQLDLYCGAAAEALRFSNRTTSGLSSLWVNSRNVIKDIYDSLSVVEGNYCFTTNCYLEANYYRARYNCSYTNLGNSPELNAKLDFSRCEKYKDTVRFVNVGIDEIDVLEDINYRRIVDKFNLLKKNNNVDASITFVDYLRNAQAISEETKYCYSFLINRKYIKETDNKFASKISQKNMTNSDKNVQVTCVAAGNPDGEYFSTGWTGKFKGSHKEECWTGKMLTTTYFDGTTGAVLAGEGKIAAYATYSETHALWTDDEYWAFVDSTGGNYFYLLTRTGTIL